MDALSPNPADVVRRQLDAYNAKNIGAFITEWADDAEYYEHPSNLLARGAAAIRERHVARFKEPDLHGKLISRVALGNKVIDHEHVTRNFPEGRGWMEVVAIYEVADGRIAKAWFIMGPRTLNKP